ncbi:Uncharacterized protein J7T55_001645 [Diaporthe amygdali]|uniref:uncharacterized protein n=1 Tax=Phomopsis amygdali TaxID=1214568 RepID=UPI0022FF1A90|nr:uncharacterized protein J7T55_001645 [Diaporthe amygdali]KAJ0115235.1 Uncharacterized protein J7T55_001645 [Diaporthe amygdali]
MGSVLFITNPELGQLQVALAVAHSIVQQDASVEIHLATYKDAIAPGVIAAASAYATASHSSPTPRPFVLHEISGVPWADAVRSRSTSGKTLILPSLRRRPTLWSWRQHLREVGYFFQPWDGPQLVEVYRSVLDIVKSVNPGVTLVDSMNLPGNVACRHLGVKWCILTPSSLKDWAGGEQPAGRIFWKYPAMGSGLSYPLAWYQVPINVCLVLLMLYHMIRGEAETNDVANYFEKHTDGATIRLDRAPNPFVRALVGIIPELDYPLKVIPENILPCGPIVRPSAPIAQSDPDLARWLSRGPTIYANLGSHCPMNEKQAYDFAMAIRLLLDKAQTSGQDAPMQKLQVLWKLKKEGSFATSAPGCAIHAILGDEVRDDLIRIVEWVEAEPMSILESGHVVLSIHHGGANSFAEAIVVLVVELNCIRLLHIGLFAQCLDHRASRLLTSSEYQLAADTIHLKHEEVVPSGVVAFRSAASEPRN